MSATVGLGVAITLADMFTPKLKNAEKGVGRFAAKLAALSTASVAIGQKMSASFSSAYETFGETAQKQGDLMSLGVKFKDMEKISQAGLKFSNTWSGVVLKDFMSATYDIKSGIDSLSTEGISKMTSYALLTGKATKSSAEVMSKAFAMGYGIFRNQFGSDFEFGEKFSAAFSRTVQAFRTDGTDISMGLATIKADATSMGVGMTEQFAVLGALKKKYNTAAEAGTAYSSFLANAGKAQKTLGLKFVDNNGHLLSTATIVDKITNKFKDLENVKTKLLLRKAFGDKEALSFVNTIAKDTDGLRKSILALEEAQKEGIAFTTKMAEAREYGQESKLLGDQLQNLAYIFGKSLAPSMGWVNKKFSVLVGWVQDFVGNHKQLATTVASGLVVFAGLATTLGTLGVAVAGISFGLSTLGLSMSGVLLVGAPVLALLSGVAYGGYMIYKHWEKISKKFKPFFQGLWMGLKEGQKHLDKLVKHLHPLGEAFDWVVSKGSAFLQWMGSLLGLTTEGKKHLYGMAASGDILGNQIANMFGTIVDAIGGIKNTLASWDIGTYWNTFMNWIVKVKNTLSSWAENLREFWDGLRESASGISEPFIKLWGNIKELGSAFLGLFSVFQDFGGWMLDIVGWNDKASESMFTFREAGRVTGSVIKSVFGAIGNIISTSVHGWVKLFEGIIYLANKVKALANGASSTKKVNTQNNNNLYDGLSEKVLLDMGINPENRNKMTMPALKDIPTMPAATSPEKPVTINEGDMHISFQIQGENDPRKIAKLAVREIKQEIQNKKDRSMYS